MTDVWTIYFNREGLPVGVSGPSLDVPEGGRPNGMAQMQVVPLAPLERRCAGGVDDAINAAADTLHLARVPEFRNLFPGDTETARAAAMREVFWAAQRAILNWRRRFSERATPDEWGVE